MRKRAAVLGVPNPAGMEQAAASRCFSAPDMPLAALPCQCDLVLALAVAQAVFLGTGGVAVGAGDAFLVMGGGDFFRRDRVAAGVAEPVVAFLEAMLHRDALVEHEAGAFPEAFLLRHFLEIFQDAALEVVDIVETLFLHEDG